MVFTAGWTVTTVGLDVGERTLITRKRLSELQASHGPQSDFVVQLADFYLGPGRRKAAIQARLCTIRYEVGTVIDPTPVGTLGNHSALIAETRVRIHPRRDSGQSHGLERKQRSARRSLRNRGRGRTQTECSGLPHVRCGSLCRALYRAPEGEVECHDSVIFRWPGSCDKWYRRRSRPVSVAIAQQRT